MMCVHRVMEFNVTNIICQEAQLRASDKTAVITEPVSSDNEVKVLQYIT